MWLLFALMTPLFWALVHIADSHCVEEIFEKPWMGVITSSLSSILVFLLLPVILPFVDVSLPEPYILFLAFGVGALIQISQAFYFKALSYTEAGIIAAYWNMTPALLPIFSFIFFREILQLPQYVGIAVLIVTSVGMCVIDINFHGRWTSFFLMGMASFLQVIALLLEDIIFQHADFFVGFYAITFGLIITGSLPLLLPHVRKTFTKNAHRIKPAIIIFLTIEALNLCALATSQKAIDLGNPSLVAAVETSVPAYTFLMSLIFLALSSKLGDTDTLKNLPLKFGLVGLMVIGVLLVSKTT